MTTTRRDVGKTFTVMAMASAGLGRSAMAQGATIKMDLLHSLSGTMATSETVLKDTLLMAIDEINAKRGLCGAKLEAVGMRADGERARMRSSGCIDPAPG